MHVVPPKKRLNSWGPSLVRRCDRVEKTHVQQLNLFFKMNLKSLFYRLYEYFREYNLFTVETGMNDDDEPQDPTITLKSQRCATWLYIFLLIGK